MTVETLLKFASDFYWTLFLGVGSLGVKTLRDMTASIRQLNLNIAVILTRIDSHEKKLDDHENRIRKIE